MILEDINNLIFESATSRASKLIKNKQFGFHQTNPTAALNIVERSKLLTPLERSSNFKHIDSAASAYKVLAKDPNFRNSKRSIREKTLSDLTNHRGYEDTVHYSNLLDPDVRSRSVISLYGSSKPLPEYGNVGIGISKSKIEELAPKYKASVKSLSKPGWGFELYPTIRNRSTFEKIIPPKIDINSSDIVTYIPNKSSETRQLVKTLKEKFNRGEGPAPIPLNNKRIKKQLGYQ